MLVYVMLDIKSQVYYLILQAHKYSTVDQSFWLKVDSDAALLPS